ncbi:MAG: MBL fold metallo-hydrolase, partial [Chloroflexi bacterium]|nr:MBL fold metallo-hydrolase [Chloroflexota bacterium]
AAEAGAVLVRDGDAIQIGNIRLDVRHTPGHTPEHISFELTDVPAADRPMGFFTGDFVFVGDVGRPDLLETAAKVAGTKEPAARRLFHSLQAFKQQPDYVQIWPGHGAGSACGKGISAVPQSTIGYERISNWAFQIEDEEEFVRAVLAGQPEPPKYFAEMKRINKVGPRILGGLHWPERLPADRLADVLASGGLVVDTRHAADFAGGHLPRTINIPLDGSFVTWAGWLIPYGTDFYLLIDDHRPERVEEAARGLASIGLDWLAGYFGADTLATHAAEGWGLDTIAPVSVDELAQLLHDSAVVVDVRGQTEWEAGHIPGAKHIPLGYLVDRLGELPHDVPLVVHCQTGARSAIAASVLQARDHRNVRNFGGGLAAWQARGLAIERSPTVGPTPHAA